jgi:serine/threonine protein phosphatase PrpC
MAYADLHTAAVPAELGDKPRDNELDLFGLTHSGKRRPDNQDHFLMCTVHPEVVVHATNLPKTHTLPLRGERLATILMVADGVGGGAAGREASQVALETITRYVSSTLRCYHAAGSAQDEEFFAALRAAALEAHAAVRAYSRNRTHITAAATTLTMAIAVWPRLYVTQVGDSRCYVYQDGVLRQVTRDQTVAQGMADLGAITADQVAVSPFSNVLASAIGGPEAVPEVTRLPMRPGIVVLMCSDGLTKHLSNAEIEKHIAGMQSSEQLCRTLLDLALERGGTDNITVLAGRARKS